ncbi:MAG: hypothetical protein V4736_04000 [Bdellovibrionota bacterium]
MELTVMLQKLVSVMIVWNVGQGQWITQVTNDSCLHFDAGGEVLPWDRIESICKNKLNKIYISHWDADHISGLNFFHWSGIKYCRASTSDFPLPETLQWFRQTEFCLMEKKPGVKIIRPQWSEKELRKKRPRNESSLFFLTKNYLMTGDAPQKSERKNLLNNGELLPSGFQNITVLILGHHGSKTSTSTALLKKLSRLKLAISSSRKAVYGHPHADVQNKLVKFNVSLLKTEDWGNIILPEQIANEKSF